MTSKYHRRFPEEFKAEAVRMYLEDPATTYAVEARFQIESWITGYNTIRRHSSLGQISPLDYEQRHANLALAA